MAEACVLFGTLDKRVKRLTDRRMMNYDSTHCSLVIGIDTLVEYQYSMAGPAFLEDPLSREPWHKHVVFLSEHWDIDAVLNRLVALSDWEPSTLSNTKAAILRQMSARTCHRFVVEALGLPWVPSVNSPDALRKQLGTKGTLVVTSDDLLLPAASPGYTQVDKPLAWMDYASKDYVPSPREDGDIYGCGQAYWRNASGEGVVVSLPNGTVLFLVTAVAEGHTVREVARYPGRVEYEDLDDNSLRRFRVAVKHYPYSRS